MGRGNAGGLRCAATLVHDLCGDSEVGARAAQSADPVREGNASVRGWFRPPTIRAPPGGLTTRSSRLAALRLLFKIVGILVSVPTYGCSTYTASG